MNKIVRDIRLVANRMVNAVKYRSNGYIVFGEWMGKRANDNAFYLANHIARHYPKVKLCWIADKDADLSKLVPSIRRIVRDSAEADDIICNAIALVMNQGYTDFSSNPSFNVKGPLTVNLWHGVMWKKIGFDAIEGRSFIRNLEYRFQIMIHRTDLYVAPSEEYLNIYKAAFFLKERNFIRAGQPRNSLFFCRECVEFCRKRFCEKNGVDSKAKIIAYLPTFRDSGDSCFSFFGVKDPIFWKLLEERNIVIVHKAHFADVNQYRHEEENKRILCINDVSAQELMATSDMLITDYSSCFFDYLILDRPIIHFIYDYDFYKNKDRGLYYDVEQVACGDTPRTEQELIEAIRKNLDESDRNRLLRSTRREKFISFENEHSCEVITRILFKNIRKKHNSFEV